MLALISSEPTNMPPLPLLDNQTPKLTAVSLRVIISGGQEFGTSKCVMFSC